MCAAKMMIKNRDVLPKHKSGTMDVRVMKIVDINHVECRDLYICTEEEILLTIQAADAFGESNHRPTPFHSSAFYRHARFLSDRPHICHMK